MDAIFIILEDNLTTKPLGLYGPHLLHTPSNYRDEFLGLDPKCWLEDLNTRSQESRPLD